KSAILEASRSELEALLAAAGIDCGFEAGGLAYVYRDPARFSPALAETEQLRALGIDVETLDGAELERIEPSLRPGVAGGLRFPGDAQLRPEAYVAGLARAVRAAGGVIDEHCAVSGFRGSGGRIDAVVTATGDRRARDIVLALGAWSPQVARALSLRLPMQPGKG